MKEQLHQIVRSKYFEYGLLAVFIGLFSYVVYITPYDAPDKGIALHSYPFQPTSTPIPSLIDAPVTFHGQDVQFTYNQNGLEGEKLTTQILGRKIYLGSQGNVTAGAFIEVLSKGSDQTLSKAIQQQLLKGYDENNCYVSEQSYPPTKTYKDGYSIAQVVADNAHYCPQPYADDKNNSFFLIDYSQPQKFAFIYEGRDALGSFANGKSWVSTLQIH